MIAEKLVEALRACLDVLNELPTWSNAGHAMQLGNEALAAHEAEQEQAAASELDRERAARREAQIELERYKSLLSRARIDLMRELREQGWVLQQQEQEGEAVAWRWEHYHTTTGVVVGSGLSDTKVQPTRHAMPAGPDFDNGWIGTRVQPLYTRPQQPLSDEQIVRIYEAPELAGTRHASGTEKAIAIARAIERAHCITKDTK